MHVLAYFISAVFVFFLFALITVVVGLIVTVIYLCAFPIRKWAINKQLITAPQLKKIESCLTILVLTTSGYLTYDAFYPDDSYYFGEFKEVTLRDRPQSAEIVRKSASYPDLHGDYCSSALMKLSADEYRELFNDLSKDNRLKEGDLMESRQFEYSMKGRKTEEIRRGFKRSIKGQEDHHLFIGFLDDEESIVVNICYT